MLNCFSLKKIIRINTPFNASLYKKNDQYLFYDFIITLKDHLTQLENNFKEICERNDLSQNVNIFEIKSII